MSLVSPYLDSLKLFWKKIVDYAINLIKVIVNITFMFLITAQLYLNFYILNNNWYQKRTAVSVEKLI